MTIAAFDERMDRIAAGDRLSADEIADLCAAPNLLVLGTLADATRRRRHAARTTFLRVATVTIGQAASGWQPPPAARAIRVLDAPQSVAEALGAIASVRAAAESRFVSAFSWGDIERLSESPLGLLKQLRAQGLDAVGDLWLDSITDPPAAVDQLRQAGFDQLCLGVEAAGGDRLALWLRAAELQKQFGCIRALNPLPMELRAYRPTTGYDDVKMVAAARLAAPDVETIQVDWMRYGPKLAQVALTFGADDLVGVSPTDEAPEGRRRAPLEEIRRNIEAAGFEPLERDGRFRALS